MTEATENDINNEDWGLHLPKEILDFLGEWYGDEEFLTPPRRYALEQEEAIRWAKSTLDLYESEKRRDGLQKSVEHFVHARPNGVSIAEVQAVIDDFDNETYFDKAEWFLGLLLSRGKIKDIGNGRVAPVDNDPEDPT